MSTVSPSSSEPLVSVILPTYKRLDYLRGAIASALAQTYRHTEIIVSDDAASPEAADLVASFGDSRLRYRHNGDGVGATRNALAAYLSASGGLLATLHDDDEWEPAFLERLVPPLVADPTLAIAFSDHWIMGADGVVDPRASVINTRRWRRHGLREGVYRPFYSLAVVDRAVPVVMASVLRKSAIDWSDFPREMEPAYDLWLGYLASREGAGAYYTPERLTRYRVHGGSDSVQRRHETALAYCYERFVADERLRSILLSVKRVRGGYQTNLGVALLSQERRREARKALWEGVKFAPSVRAIAAMVMSYLPGTPAPRIERLRRLYRRLHYVADARERSRTL